MMIDGAWTWTERLSFVDPTGCIDLSVRIDQYVDLYSAYRSCACRVVVSRSRPDQRLPFEEKTFIFGFWCWVVVF